MQPQISASQLRTWDTCRRLWYYQKQLRLEVIPAKLSPAIKAGALWDTCMNALYSGESVGDAVNKCVDAYEIDEHDVAMVKGLYRAHRALIIPDTSCICQDSLEMTLDDGTTIIGILDRTYFTAEHPYFVETKLTGDPSFYDSTFFTIGQVGTYFLLYPLASYVKMEITRKPKLKLNREQESAEHYGERVYQDAISRPRHYFIGYDREKQDFGKRFYRSEFPDTELLDKYQKIAAEIRAHAGQPESAYDRRFTSCIRFGRECEFLPVCKTGGVSQNIYQVRHPKED
uniref:Putative PD-(D/E)XK nuclease superfamily protein n=1 Tax=viral metagenome TaxID=1070528 RepID=A0A6M3KY58_9ZZZZ